ncbi:M23 family metallopeptidase [Bifidobacterium avesanii]|nr:M23 family metallopeptidase [Bifidobacterium avesanii]KAB8295497.1 peptidase, M23 family [Bifidobacterium avesanii]
MRRERHERNGRAWTVAWRLALALLCALMAAVGAGGALTASAFDAAETTRAGETLGARPAQSAGCRASMVWPLKPQPGTAKPTVLEPFKAPPQPWFAGHRGVDLEAASGDAILAPAAGTVAFVGKVGGKDAVSVRHGRLTSTFEPATTTLSVGATVSGGEPFAAVSGSSDHCDGRCLHWGVRDGEESYRDPALLASNHRIALTSTKAVKSTTSARVR